MYTENGCEKGNLKLTEQLGCSVSSLLWSEGEYKKSIVGAD
jgi:hypothetical protein